MSEPDLDVIFESGVHVNVDLLGVGEYCQANWHTHCLRPLPEVLYFGDRLPV